MDPSPAGFSRHGDPPGKNTGVGCQPSSQTAYIVLKKMSFRVRHSWGPIWVLLLSSYGTLFKLPRLPSHFHKMETIIKRRQSMYRTLNSFWWGFPCVTSGKEPTCQCRRHKRWGSITGLGRSPGGGHGNPLQYSCLENPVDRGAW